MTKRRFPALQIEPAPRADAAAAAGSQGSGNGDTNRKSRRETRDVFAPLDIERLKQLEDDYRKLKQIVAGFDLD